MISVLCEHILNYLIRVVFFADAQRVCSGQPASRHPQQPGKRVAEQEGDQEGDVEGAKV